MDIDYNPKGIKLTDKPIEKMDMEQALEYREKLVDKINKWYELGKSHVASPLEHLVQQVDEHVHLLDVGARTVEAETVKKVRRRKPSIFDDDDD